jgi:hypothetical protein
MQKKQMNYRKICQWILWLVALHSLGFGLALISLPIPVIEFFGFRLQEKFFAVQGGVFHIVVSAAYIMAALDLGRAQKLIILACMAKFSATIFLISYYLFVSPIFMVLFSGIADFLMGLVILLSYQKYRKSAGLNTPVL